MSANPTPPQAAGSGIQWSQWLLVHGALAVALAGIGYLTAGLRGFEAGAATSILLSAYSLLHNRWVRFGLTWVLLCAWHVAVRPYPWSLEVVLVALLAVLPLLVGWPRGLSRSVATLVARGALAGGVAGCLFFFAYTGVYLGQAAVLAFFAAGALSALLGVGWLVAGAVRYIREPAGADVRADTALIGTFSMLLLAPPSWLVVAVPVAHGWGAAPPALAGPEDDRDCLRGLRCDLAQEPARCTRR